MPDKTAHDKENIEQETEDRRFAIIRGAQHGARQAGRWWTGADLDDAFLHAAWLNAQYEAWHSRHSKALQDVETTVKELESAYTEQGGTDLYARVLDAREARDLIKAEPFQPLPVTDEDLTHTRKRLLRGRRIRIASLATVVSLVSWHWHIGGDVILGAGGVAAIIAWAQGHWPGHLAPPPRLDERIDPKLLSAPAPIAEEPEAQPERGDRPVDRGQEIVSIVRDMSGDGNNVHLADLAPRLHRARLITEPKVSAARAACEEIGLPVRPSVKIRIAPGPKGLSVKEGVHAQDLLTFLNPPTASAEIITLGHGGTVIYPQGRTAPTPSPAPSHDAR